MKIAMPINEKRVDSGVCISFGRTPYFLVHDTETKENLFIENTAAKSTGGAGIKAAQIIADNGADAVLTPRCGENAAGVLQNAGIKIYKTVGDSVESNIKDFISGNLSLLEEIHAGLHNHGKK
jgi:predicted Fe-Mo cluster-binding NifX family protein